MEEEIKNMVKDEAEVDDLREFLRKVGNEEKGIDNFFLEVIATDDTTKVGNIKDTEMGTPLVPVLTLKELARDCKLIPSMKSFEDDFKEQSEDILATSLSRNGFLINSRITQKKSLTDSDKRKTRRVGLFGRKEVVEE